MNAATHPLWLDLNQRFLTAQLARIRARLAGLLGEQAADVAQLPVPQMPAEFTPAIGRLAACFGLSAFECDALLLAAGAELDSSLALLCGRALRLNGPAAPTFSLALAALESPHWSALSSVAPLRRYRLLQPGPSDLMTTAPLRIDERVLHFLAGIESLDQRLASVLAPVAGGGRLTDAQRRVALQIAAAIESSGTEPMGVQILGRSAAAIEEVIAAASSEIGVHLWRVAVIDLPVDARERAEWLALWRRDARLAHAALMIDARSGDITPEALRPWLEGCGSRVFVALREPLPVGVAGLRFEVPAADIESQFAAWRAATGERVAAAELAHLVAQFPLEPREIFDLAAARGAHQPAVWQLCRERQRRGLDGLAQRLESQVGWDDLVLPDAETGLLKSIAAQVRQRDRVYREWGFAAKGTRGLGLSALFAGPSGTGKTLAAEVIGNELRLDVYRIDLSSVVSKYIGETEKNLRRVFDAAEEGGAILLFDEADALFGKRSEVRDSHDRYANIEIAYLLTRMESYRGLSILTTNMKSALDDAFLRRIRFVVQFPFPGASQRAEIWRRMFPPATPTCGLDYPRLARMTLAGGNIRKVALGAAFGAGDGGTPIGMAEILAAARGEYAKLERPMTETEIG